MSLEARVAAFARLSRLPFLLPGIIPFTVGLAIGYLTCGYLDIGLTALSYIGLILIMLSTYYSNEYFDYIGDVLNRYYNKFSGGSRALADGYLPRKIGFYSLFSSTIIFLILFFCYISWYFLYRPLILYMAIAGLVSGVFYSAPPFKWAYRGVGEAIIGICYGWLATISGYYISTGFIDITATLISLPAVFSVVAVIFINEFPDYEADMAVGKMNLVVRLGLDRSVKIYPVIILAVLISEFIACYVIAGYIGLIMSVIPSVLAAKLMVDIGLKNAHSKKTMLEKTCEYTLLLNISSPLILLIAGIIKWIVMAVF